MFDYLVVFIPQLLKENKHKKIKCLIKKYLKNNNESKSLLNWFIFTVNNIFCF